jgi:hypothetical protein
MLQRDAIVMANARRLIKANKKTSNAELYMELFGTGCGTARMLCANNLGLDPDGNDTCYTKMMQHINGT